MDSGLLGYGGRRGWSLHPLPLLLVLVAVHPVTSVDLTLHYRLVEEARPPVRLVSIPAASNFTRDLGVDAVSKLTYSFLSQNRYTDLFYLDPHSGFLETQEVIDRDVLCPNQDLCVIELDVAVQPAEYFRTVKVEILILDLNDNPPVFTPQYLLKSVSENTKPGPLFPIFPPVDPDSPSNSTLTYVTEGHVDFLELRDLHVYLLQELDREVTSSYSISVIARDSGHPALSGTLVIDVEVTDTNDHSPVFEQQGYQISVPEDIKVSTSIARICARDPDVGSNGDILYSFSGQTQARYGYLFHIGITSGVISVQEELDAERARTYNLVVVAQDQGLGAIPAQVPVTLLVQDVNDNKPLVTFQDPNTLIPISASRIVLEEHADTPAIAALVSVLDPDSGANGEVYCGISDTVHFQLKKIYDTDYTLSVIKEMDREVRQTYHFTLRCYDNGDPQLVQSENVTLRVLDMNDHKPVFTRQTYTVTLQETASLSAYVTQVSASDLDAAANGEVTYLLDYDAQGLFHIHPDTGVITAIQPLDRERYPHLVFHVLAKDGGDAALMSRAKVVVNIEDVDDEQPQFLTKHYTFNVTEGQDSQLYVGRVVAVDRDLPPYNNFSFYLSSVGGALDKFTVNPITGVVTTKRPLNREAESRYHIEVIVQSDTVPPTSDTATATVLVNDINDNAPVIEFPTERDGAIIVRTDADIGTRVTRVRAVDADVGLNAKLTYSIADGVPDNEFVIDPTEGVVAVNSALDGKNGRVFRLQIMVSDNAVNTMMTATHLEIHVNGTIGAGPGRGRAGSAGGRRAGPTEEQYTIIIACVVLATVLVAVALVVAILIVRRRAKAALPPPDTKLWPCDRDIPGDGASEPPTPEKLGPALPEKKLPPPAVKDPRPPPPLGSPPQPPGAPLVRQNFDLILGLQEDPLSMQLHPAGGSPDRGDGDSGCADLSNSGSQGSNDSNEDSDGSKRSSKASDSGVAPDEIPILNILDAHGCHPSYHSDPSLASRPPCTHDPFSDWLSTQAQAQAQAHAQARHPPQRSYSDTLSRDKRKSVRFLDPPQESEEDNPTNFDPNCFPLRPLAACKAGGGAPERRVHFAESVDTYTPNDSFCSKTDDDASVASGNMRDLTIPIPDNGCHGHTCPTAAHNDLHSALSPDSCYPQHTAAMGTQNISRTSSGYGSDGAHGDSCYVHYEGGHHLPCTEDTILQYHMRNDSETSQSLASFV